MSMSFNLTGYGAEDSYRHGREYFSLRIADYMPHLDVDGLWLQVISQITVRNDWGKEVSAVRLVNQTFDHDTGILTKGAALQVEVDPHATCIVLAHLPEPP